MPFWFRACWLGMLVVIVAASIPAAVHDIRQGKIDRRRFWWTPTFSYDPFEELYQSRRYVVAHYAAVYAVAMLMFAAGLVSLVRG